MAEAVRLKLALLLVVQIVAGCHSSVDNQSLPGVIVDRDVDVPMRDEVVLRADIYRPDTAGRHPTLVYRTPYGKHSAVIEYQTHLKAVERGYVVVLQDVRGRYASEGIFDAYRNEGADGYDTIEWAAKQAWSNGDVGTYGLSYPGAVQWLAAMQSPPHLKAMVPAMTFSTPRNFFYMNGVFDLSWLPWVYFNIAPDARMRLGITGATSDSEVADAWEREGEDILSFRPLADLPFLRREAPFYFEWLKHPPTDNWWDWAEIRGRYQSTDAAVLNLSGWFDEAYGPEGAVTNHLGITASRENGVARSHLILGPWKHGVASTKRERLGERDFGPQSAIDYDAELLRFFDHYLRNEDDTFSTEPAIRYFMMGANEWRTSDSWPPPDAEDEILCLATAAENGVLDDCGSETTTAESSFTADPAHPVVDTFANFEVNDYQALATRDDVLVFDTPPLGEALSIAGNATARMFVSCDCVDFDLWVRLLDVYPDGRAINLMSPGADLQRMSYRDSEQDPQLLTPGEIYEVAIDRLISANRFEAGHRVRIQVSASFAPHVSLNLQTGQSEVVSSESVPATITVHHDGDHTSALILPVVR